MDERAARVLVLEDDAPVRDLVRNALEGGGLDVAVAATAGGAFCAIVRSQPDLILVDPRCAEGTAPSLVARLRTVAPRARVVAFTAETDNSGYSGPAHLDGIMGKPFDLSDLPWRVNAFPARPTCPAPTGA